MSYEIDAVAQSPPDDDRRHELGCQPIPPARPVQSGHLYIHRKLAFRLRGTRTRNSGREIARIGRVVARFFRTFGVMRISHRVSPVRPLNKDVQDTLEVARTILIDRQGVKTTQVYINI
jgi:hypothetical protein